MGKKEKTTKKSFKKMPRTVQDTLPYIEGYENGMMQVETGRFTKTYEIEDISFRTKSEDEQEGIFENYMKLLNAIQPGEDLFLNFVNYKERAADTLYGILPQAQGDEYDHYRNELAQMIKTKVTDGRNNIKTKKYATLKVDAPSVDEAVKKMNSAENEFVASYRRVTQTSPKALNLAARLKLVDTILNGSRPNYYFTEKDGQIFLDYNDLRKKKLTTKDIIAPDAFKFNGNDFIIGDRYGMSFYLDNVANWMNTNFISELSEVNFESCMSIHISAIPQQEAVKMIHNKSVNINAEIIQKTKDNASGYIPTELRNASEQIDDLQEDLLNRDQKLFYMGLTITIFADSKEELSDLKKTIQNISTKYMSRILPLSMQQERGLAASLPFGNDRTLFQKRLLTTESLAVFIPFDEVNTLDEGGFYYGINAINKSLIIYNRLKGQNYNGLVLGSSGSGKSFSSKREMTNVLLNTDSDVYIVDPDGEYKPLADAFDGTVVKIAPGNGVYINPFDLDIDTSHDSDSDPIAIKTDFICGMLETMLGEKAKLTPIQKAIVTRCVRIIYKPYLEHLVEMPVDKNGKRKTIDRDHCPTMQSLFDILLSQQEAEAQMLALIMEPYVTGSFDTFAHRTNVDLSNRLIIYDLKDIGTNLQEIALKVCTNDIWTRMMANRRQEKWTWFYIDEFHLLLSNDSTSQFLKTVWKRARKWQGVPTGITQNVEDLLASSEARAIINNTTFTYMMNQSKMDRDMLAEICGLSPSDVEYITNVDRGCGLIYTGSQAIPFVDEFPANTELYKVMTTKPGEE